MYTPLFGYKEYHRLQFLRGVMNIRYPPIYHEFQRVIAGAKPVSQKEDTCIAIYFEGYSIYHLFDISKY